MNIFLTGGAGYIGSSTAEILLNAGHHVTVYDSLITGHRGAVPDGVDFIHADLGDEDALKAALAARKFDAVMHFAAFIEVGESMKDPGKFIRNNLVNSSRLIEAATRSGVERFVFSSTAAVYRSCEESIDETCSLNPQNPYGYTKLATERILEWYRKLHGLHFAVLRYFNASGALPNRGEAHHPESHLIPLVLQVALGQRESIGIYGTDYPTPDGTAIRDYIHIADLVSAHLLALDALSERDKLVYNIGTGRGYSVNEVIETARSVTRHPIPAVETPRRAGDPARLVASSMRIQRELGWKAVNSDLKNILETAWAWHESHPNGWDK